MNYSIPTASSVTKVSGFDSISNYVKLSVDSVRVSKLFISLIRLYLFLTPT